MSELKPCPFCGGDAELFKNAGYVYCTTVDCPASELGMVDKNTDEEAIKQWNTRNDLDKDEWVSVDERLPPPTMAESGMTTTPRPESHWGACDTGRVEAGLNNERGIICN